MTSTEKLECLAGLAMAGLLASAEAGTDADKLATDALAYAEALIKKLRERHREGN